MGDAATVEAQERQADFLFLRQVGQGVNLRVSEPLDVPRTEKGNNLLSISNKSSVLFAATRDGFVVQKLDAIRKQFSSANRNETPALTALHAIGTLTNAELSDRVLFLRVADDESKLIVGLANGRMAIWDIQSFIDGDAKHSTIVQPPSSELNLVEVAPNPSDRPELVAILFSDRSDVRIRRAKIAMLNIRTGSWQGELNVQGKAQATCLCWSVRGKQVVVGLENGELVQMTPEGQEKERIARVKDLTGDYYVEDVVWLENHVFLVTYNQPAMEDDTPEHQYEVYTLLRDTSAGNRITAVHFNDPTPPFGDTTRYGQRYVTRIRQWSPMKHMLVMGNTSSTDVGLLGCSSEESGTSAWQVLELEDTSRPALPFSSVDKSSDTSLVGLDLDTTSQDNIDDPQAAARGEDGKGKMPAVPILLIYINDGLLLAYHFVNAHPSAGPYPHMTQASGGMHNAAIPSPTSTARSSEVAQSKPSVAPTFANTSAFGFGSGAATPAFGQTVQIGQKAASPFATANRSQSTSSASSAGGGFGSFAAKAAPASFGNLGNTGAVGFGGAITPKDSGINERPFGDNSTSTANLGGGRAQNSSTSFAFGTPSATMADSNKPAFGSTSAFGASAIAADNFSSSPFAANTSPAGKPAFGQTSPFSFGSPAASSIGSGSNVDKIKEDDSKSNSSGFGAFAAKANSGFSSFTGAGQQSSFSFGSTATALPGLGGTKKEDAESKPLTSAFGGQHKSAFSFANSSFKLPGDKKDSATDDVATEKKDALAFSGQKPGTSSAFSFGAISTSLPAESSPASPSEKSSTGKDISTRQRDNTSPKDAASFDGVAAAPTTETSKPAFSFGSITSSLPKADATSKRTSDQVESEIKQDETKTSVKAEGGQKASDDQEGISLQSNTSEAKHSTEALERAKNELATEKESSSELGKTESASTSFSFGVPTSNEKELSGQKASAFSFGNAPMKPLELAEKTESGFAFGDTTTKRMEASDKPAQPFSFAAKPIEAAEKPKPPFSFAPMLSQVAEKSKAAFSFGTPSTKPAEATSDKPIATFSFGSPSTKPTEQVEEPEAPSSFGGGATSALKKPIDSTFTSIEAKSGAATNGSASISKKAEHASFDDGKTPAVNAAEDKKSKNTLGGVNAFDFSGLSTPKGQQGSQTDMSIGVQRSGGEKTVPVAAPFKFSKSTQMPSFAQTSVQTSNSFSFNASTQTPEPVAAPAAPIKNLMDAKNTPEGSPKVPAKIPSPFAGFGSATPSFGGSTPFGSATDTLNKPLQPGVDMSAKASIATPERLAPPPRLSMSGADSESSEATQGHDMQDAFLKLYLTMEREFELLRKNVERCGTFQSKLGERRGKSLGIEDARKPETWSFGEFDAKQALIDDLRSNIGEVDELNSNFKAQLRELQSEQLKVESKCEEIARFVRARQDPTLKNTVKVRQLGPEHQENRDRLRRSHNTLKDGLSMIDVQIQKLRKKVLDERSATPASLKTPTIESIRISTRNITASAEARLLELEEMELTLSSMFNVRSNGDLPSLKKFGSMSFDDRTRDLLADESELASLETLEQNLPIAFDTSDAGAKAAFARQRNARKLQEAFCHAREQPLLTVKKAKSEARDSKTFRTSDLHMNFAKGPIHIDEVVVKTVNAATPEQASAPSTPAAQRPAFAALPIDAGRSNTFSPSGMIPGAFKTSFDSPASSPFEAPSPSSGAFMQAASKPALNFGASLPSSVFDLPPESAPFQPGSIPSSSTGGRGIHAQKSGSKRNAAVALPPATASAAASVSTTPAKSDFFSTPVGRDTHNSAPTKPISFSFGSPAAATSSPKHSFTSFVQTGPSTPARDDKETSKSTATTTKNEQQHEPAAFTIPPSASSSFSFNPPSRGPYTAGVGSAFTTFKGPQFMKPSISSPLAKAQANTDRHSLDSGEGDEDEGEDEDEDEDEDEEGDEDEWEEEEEDEEEEGGEDDDVDHEDEEAEEGLSAVEEEDDDDDDE